MSRLPGFFLLWLVFIFACSKDAEKSSGDRVLNQISIPYGFPEINFPKDNDFTPERWTLGKKLFYDVRLSVDSSISCAHCHDQSFGFAHNQALTSGVFNRPATRNAPTLANVAYHPYFTREGGVPTLEMQVLVPVSEHNEFGFNLVLIQDRLSSDTAYQAMARRAYGRSFDTYTITRAISNFERSLLSGNSKYDQFLKGDLATLSEEESLGQSLFFSERCQCSTCHSGFNFTDYGFKNNGLYEVYSDEGRYRLTLKEEDRALFKTASLRNLAYTSPYMFDGSLSSLEAVIEHYNRGGKGHKHQSPLVKPLGLNEVEKKALVAFLSTLNDQDFVQNPYFTKG